MSVINVNKDNFENEVLKSDKLVITDFWAPWCVPCKMVAPVLEELANDYPDSLKVAKINVDEEGELAVEYSIVSIPALLIFKDGKMVDQQIGAAPKNLLESKIKQFI
jgi:thioredoxin 1